MSDSNLTWTIGVIIFESGNAISFTAKVIFTTQNALAEFVTVICDAFINVILVFIILKYVVSRVQLQAAETTSQSCFSPSRMKLKRSLAPDFECFTYITETNRILTSSTAIYTISTTRAN